MLGYGNEMDGHIVDTVESVDDISVIFFDPDSENAGIDFDEAVEIPVREFVAMIGSDFRDPETHNLIEPYFVSVVGKVGHKYILPADKTRLFLDASHRTAPNRLPDSILVEDAYNGETLYGESGLPLTDVLWVSHAGFGAFLVGDGERVNDLFDRTTYDTSDFRDPYDDDFLRY